MTCTIVGGDAARGCGRTCRAAIAAAQPTGLPPKVLPCVPGVMHWHNTSHQTRIEAVAMIMAGHLHDGPVAQRGTDGVHAAAQRLRAGV